MPVEGTGTRGLQREARALLEFRQMLLGLVALGDVVHGADQGRDAAVGGGRHRRDRHFPDLGAGGVVRYLVPVHALAGLDGAPVFGTDQLDRFGRDHLVDQFAHHGLGRNTGSRLESGVDVDEAVLFRRTHLEHEDDIADTMLQEGKDAALDVILEAERVQHGLDRLVGVMRIVGGWRRHRLVSGQFGTWTAERSALRPMMPII